ncbi:UNVERIFIED_CONTAM: hypothetical protein H355_006100 [Colinus virginianus]|nr:hypothetical protein H355_006100 [Colinus virginianus]
MLPSTSVRGENPKNRENQTEPNQKSDGQLLKRLSSLLEQPAHILNLLPYPRLNEVPRAGHELGSAGAEIPSDPCTGYRFFKPGGLFGIKQSEEPFPEGQQMQEDSKILSTHTDVRPYPCGQCQKCFKDKVSLKAHQKTHAPRQRRCPGRGPAPTTLPFGAAPTLLQPGGLEQEAAFSPMPPLPVQKVPEGQELYSCTEKGFPSKEQLLPAQQAPLAEQAFPCVQCGEGFCPKGSLPRDELRPPNRAESPSGAADILLQLMQEEQHLVSGPQHPHEAPAGQCPCKCSEGGEGLGGKPGLQPQCCCADCVTQRQLLLKPPHDCRAEIWCKYGGCGRSFEDKRVLRVPERAHSEEKSSPCPSCL